MSAIISHQENEAGWEWKLWLEWICANAAGEVIGLSIAAAVAVGVVRAIETTVGAATMAAVIIAAGTLEGIIVGIAQWAVLRRYLRNMKWQVWTAVTAIGAFVSWTLGMLPSTLMNDEADTTPMAEISDVVKYGLAAIMGLVLGLVLGTPQWLALRRHVQRAGWWVLANAAAWAVAMPVVFVGASSSPSGVAGLIVTGILTGASAGAVAGAIHGAILTRIVRR